MSLAKCQSCAQFVAMNDIRVLDRSHDGPLAKQKILCLACVRQKAIMQIAKTQATAQMEAIAANIGGEIWEDPEFYLILRPD